MQRESVHDDSYRPSDGMFVDGSILIRLPHRFNKQKARWLHLIASGLKSESPGRTRGRH
jgi:hypothetical protein